MSGARASFPGQRRVTASDVAEAAGVSQSTVSRCFSDDKRISAATRTHVRAVAGRMGYTPNALARSLITNRSGMVAVIATRQSILAMPEMLTAISEALGPARPAHASVHPG